jgi:hypothetical protein
MLDDPRVKARTYLETTSIVSELEDVLNNLVREQPNDLHGFIVSVNDASIERVISQSMFRYHQANYFLQQSQSPKITTFNLRRLIGPAGEVTLKIDFTIALRNINEVRQNDVEYCIGSIRFSYIMD